MPQYDLLIKNARVVTPGRTGRTRPGRTSRSAAAGSRWSGTDIPAEDAAEVVDARGRLRASRAWSTRTSTGASTTHWSKTRSPRAGPARRAA